MSQWLPSNGFANGIGNNYKKIMIKLKIARVFPIPTLKSPMISNNWSFYFVIFQHLAFTWLHNNLDHPSRSTCLVSLGSPREEIIYSPWDFGSQQTPWSHPSTTGLPWWSLGPFFLRRQRIKHSTGRCSGRHDSPGAWRGGVRDLPRLVATAMCAKRDGQAMRSGSAGTGKGTWDVVLGDI